MKEELIKSLTIFTPTFNRAYCLSQLYESLVIQKNKNFVWLIIDDGSTDNTRELIDQWIKENKVDIKYIFQENKGMHAAHNTAYKYITTELNMCIDSDDYLVDDAVELIYSKWNSIQNKYNICGIVGLDVDKRGNVIGTEIPPGIEYSTLYDLYQVYKIRGDKKLVLRTDIVKKYPSYPLYENEKFVPLGTLYLMIDQQYKLACLNKPLCVVEYMEDGSTLNIYKQYKKNPQGFRYSRKLEMLYHKGILNQIKSVLHYISSTIFIKDYAFFKDNPRKILTALLFPFGLIFHLFILYKQNK